MGWREKANEARPPRLHGHRITQSGHWREREESSEGELALDWIRSQGGEKHGRRGERTPFILRSIYFESRNEGRTRGGNKEKERKPTLSRFRPSPSSLVIIFHDKGLHFSHLRSRPRKATRKRPNGLAARDLFLVGVGRGQNSESQANKGQYE